jgi:hypothetical protein
MLGRDWLLHRQLEALRPAAGVVMDAEDFQHIGANAVGNDERHFWNDQFAGAGDAAGVAEFRIY